MKKLLILVDIQNDFITGALSSPQAQAILTAVKAKIEGYKQNGDDILFTRDTHRDDFMETQEGKYLPVPHCIEGTPGHAIADGLDVEGCGVLDKPNFGSLELAKKVAGGNYNEVELCGLCTDICVVSNALILKAQMPETKIVVDARCCAGVSVESHDAALLTMKMCQVDVIGKEEDNV